MSEILKKTAAKRSGSFCFFGGIGEIAKFHSVILLQLFLQILENYVSIWYIEDETCNTDSNKPGNEI